MTENDQLRDIANKIIRFLETKKHYSRPPGIIPIIQEYENYTGIGIFKSNPKQDKSEALFSSNLEKKGNNL